MKRGIIDDADASPARRTVRRRSRVAGTPLASASRASRAATGRRGRPAQKKTQRSVVSTLLRALGHGVGVDCAEHRTALRIHHRHGDL